VKQLYIILLLIISFQIKAQDIHFSQYYLTPVLQNPALTGNFNEVDRISGVYRSQWYKVSNEPFRTIGIAYDHNFRPTKYDIDIKPSNNEQHNFWGGGVQMYYDESGVGRLVNLSVLLSGAYHMMLKSGDKLSFGAQLGFTQKRIDYNKVLVNNQYNSSTNSFDPSLSSKENFNKSTLIYPDMNIGFSYQHTFLNPRWRGYGGLAFNHLIPPTETFLYTGPKQKLGTRYNLYIAADYIASAKLTVRPVLQFQTQSQGQEFNLGAVIAYKYEEALLFFGAQGRVSAGNKNFDGIMPSIGMRYKNVRVGLCYDLNFSGLKSVSNYRGGPELGILYTTGKPQKRIINRKAPCDIF
jgi:type IX secretion system PorP/SprF family membrane protein